MDRNTEKDKAKNEDMVFYVRVQYRCNSSWQGTIQWMDGRKTSVFRSVLELGNLINDAKQCKTCHTGSKKHLPGWDEKEGVS